MEVWRIIPTEKRIDFVRQCVFGNIPKPSVVTFVIETGWTAIENGSAASEVTSHVISGDSEGKCRFAAQHGGFEPSQARSLLYGLTKI